MDDNGFSDMQLTKIILAFCLGMVVIVILVQIDHRLGEIIKELNFLKK